MIYLTTDSHFNHRKIIGMCNRPINYEELLWAGYSKLTNEDTLIHLGDICIGSPGDAHAKYIQPLRCKKILVLGNHDNKTQTWYLGHGWDFVCESFTGIYFGHRVRFSHKPIPWDGEYHVNIHGHLHERKHRPDEPIHSRNFLISLEEMGYSPLELRRILSDFNNSFRHD